jgi:hypothetical protein
MRLVAAQRWEVPNNLTALGAERITPALRRGARFPTFRTPSVIPASSSRSLKRNLTGRTGESSGPGQTGCLAFDMPLSAYNANVCYTSNRRNVRHGSKSSRRKTREIVLLPDWSPWLWWKQSGSVLSEHHWGRRGLPDHRRGSTGLPAHPRPATHSPQHVRPLGPIHTQLQNALELFRGVRRFSRSD